MKRERKFGYCILCNKNILRSCYICGECLRLEKEQGRLPESPFSPDFATWIFDMFAGAKRFNLERSEIE